MKECSDGYTIVSQDEDMTVWLRDTPDEGSIIGMEYWCEGLTSTHWDNLQEKQVEVYNMWYPDLRTYTRLDDEEEFMVFHLEIAFQGLTSAIVYKRSFVLMQYEAERDDGTLIQARSSRQNEKIV